MAVMQESSQFQPRLVHEQHRAQGVRGALAVGVAVFAFALAGGLIVAGSTGNVVALTVVGIVLALVMLFVCRGFVVVQPNESRVLILFGRYTGTLLETGLW
jgi:regulator of protease activity HflC (stomatin/prohibitin superfamily)